MIRAKVRYGIDYGRSSFLKARRKPPSLPAHEILQEAKKLRKVCDSLDVLAAQHALLEEALTVLSGNIRGSASLLEVLVALRLGPDLALESTSN
jgi:hypothetical protein